MFPAASPSRTADEAGHVAFRLAGLCAVLVYAGLEIALFANHEVWRDEAQAWWWATTIASPAEFLFVPGEGHPPLWFWLLRALSAVTDFAQARYLSLAIAIGNAALLWTLLRRDLPLLIALLFTPILLQFWGYAFRPYGLVLTAVIIALLLERRGYPIRALWVMALACGLHFFAGFLFAQWLLILLLRRVALRHLVGPALLAAAFGAMAIISGLGNASTGSKEPIQVISRAIANLAWALPEPPNVPVLLLAAVATAVIVVVGLWRSPVLPVTLGLMVAFALFGALVYGSSDWHLAFMLMQVLTGFMLAEGKRPTWLLAVLLVPQAISGVAMIHARVTAPQAGESAAYAAVVADRGGNGDLYAWPDYALSASSALHGFSALSAAHGGTLGPVDWRRGEPQTVDPALATRVTPFWLVCFECDTPLAQLEAAGLRATHLGGGIDANGTPVEAYRFDR